MKRKLRSGDQSGGREGNEKSEIGTVSDDRRSERNREGKPLPIQRFLSKHLVSGLLILRIIAC
jgi:hypothetical protein